jgi:hypothetical protein
MADTRALEATATLDEVRTGPGLSGSRISLFMPVADDDDDDDDEAASMLYSGFTVLTALCTEDGLVLV